METTIGDCHLDNRDAHSDTNSDSKKPLKLGEAEYFELMYRYKGLELLDKEIEILKQEKVVQKLLAKIAGLEEQATQFKILSVNNKKSKMREDLDSFREKVAERLQIDTLDEYLLDDETFELKHESEIENIVADKELKS